MMSKAPSCPVNVGVADSSAFALARLVSSRLVSSLLVPSRLVLQLAWRWGQPPSVSCEAWSAFKCVTPLTACQASRDVHAVSPSPSASGRDCTARTAHLPYCPPPPPLSSVERGSAWSIFRVSLTSSGFSCASACRRRGLMRSRGRDSPGSARSRFVSPGFPRVVRGARGETGNLGLASGGGGIQSRRGIVVRSETMLAHTPALPCLTPFPRVAASHRPVQREDVETVALQGVLALFLQGVHGESLLRGTAGCAEGSRGRGRGARRRRGDARPWDG